MLIDTVMAVNLQEDVVSHGIKMMSRLKVNKKPQKKKSVRGFQLEY